MVKSGKASKSEVSGEVENNSPEQQTLTHQEAIDLAVQHHTAGELSKAESIYQEILQTDPNHPDVLHLLGVIAHQKGENDTAVHLITKAIDLKPEFAEAHGNLGVSLQELGKLDEAIGHYHKAIAIKPKLTTAHYNHGLVLQELGRLDEAFACYQKALTIDPEFASAHNNLGTVLKELGRIDDALAHYHKAIDIKPDDANTHSNLAAVFLDLGKPDEAIASCREALAIKPDYAEAHNNLGLSLENLGKLEEAVAHYHKALATKPNFADAHYNLGNALKELGQLNEAVASYHKALAIKTDHAKAYYQLANVLRDLEKLDIAVTSYREALVIKPDYAEAHSNLGTTLSDLGKLDEAMASYHKALAIKPGFAEAQYNLGAVLQVLGKLDEAANCFEKADTKESRAKLLECVYAQGKKDRFYRLLEKFILEDKTNRGVAAISAFASNQFGRHDPYPFCNNPMDFVYINSIAPITDKESGLLHEIQKQLADFKLDGKRQTLLKSGIQSSGDLFLEPHGALAVLDKIIRNKIADYTSNFKASDCRFIKMWPQKYTLRGWFILMEKGGHIKSHNHPLGWLSGVFYLKMPPTKTDDGSIVFSLHKKDFPILNSNYPKKLYKVKEGDLVMFPSSLFHETIPFYSDEERLCIAFDLTPVETDGQK